MLFGVFTILGTLIILVFMKETRGKTQEEIDRMFNSDIKDEDSDVEKEKMKQM